MHYFPQVLLTGGFNAPLQQGWRRSFLKAAVSMPKKEAWLMKLLSLSLENTA